VVINTQPVTPAAPVVGTITQPTCAVATGSVVLSGLPSGSWTINPGNIAGTGTSYTISGLSAGTYNYTVNNGQCTSLASANVVINTQPVTPVAPVVGTITQPTCALATGSVVLSGLPSGNWTINPGNIAGTGTSYTISGLAAGTYNYTVNNGQCTSLASADVVINTQPVTPVAPVVGTITQPTCALATGGVVLSGLPSGSWTINPGNITGTGTSYTISGLAAGTYNYTVNNGQCTSLASANVVINTQPVTPTAPVLGTITQPNCVVATGSIVLSGLPSGSWTINPGNITGTGTSYTISGLAAGTYNYTVNNGQCTSLASADVVISTQPVTPTVNLGSDVTICADQSVTLDAGNPGSGFLWSPGGQTTQVVTIDSLGLGMGAHTIIVTVTAPNTCSASDTVVVTIDPCTDITENSKDIVLSIVPNPSNGLFFINVSGMEGPTELKIFSVSGQLVYAEMLDGIDLTNKSINLEAFPTGMYFARILNNKTLYTQKIIIEK